MEDLKLTFEVNLNDKNLNCEKSLEGVDLAIDKLKAKLLVQRKNLSDKQTFRSKAKWFEYGEKSNEFFLSLMKSRQNQKLISSISNKDKVFVGQEEVTKGITDFYKGLYEKDDKRKLINHDDKDFYKYCPKLTAAQAGKMDEELTLNDLSAALKTCTDSSPGPDGIPYAVYKSLWKISGPIILEAWKHSIEKKCLPPSHYESIITLLPKEGKDTSDIKN
jgi:hypothetical protein